jgi:hypothetical protein
MKLNYLWVITSLFLMTSCLDSPEFPEVPSIEYEDLSYVEVGGFLESDSLILKLRFEDGDGDLGLRSNVAEDRSAPFNEVSFFSYNQTTQKVTEFALDTLRGSDISLIENIVTFSDRRNIDALDTLPDFIFPERCDYYREQEIFQSGQEEPIVDDTLYYHKNPRFNNIYVGFFIETTPGNFEEFFWEYFQDECNINYDGRFPLINDIGRDKSSEGILTYRMTSIGWRNVLQNNRFKLQVFIYDRAGHVSNVIETPAVTLSEIQTN